LNELSSWAAVQFLPGALKEEQGDVVHNEVTPEKEKKITDKTAQLLVKLGMAAPAILFLQTFKSLAWLSGQFARIFVEPYLSFYEKEASEVIEVLGKVENIEALIAKIDELEKRTQEQKVKRKSEGESASLRDRMRKSIFRHLKVVK
jgi:hypothetical protein